MLRFQAHPIQRMNSPMSSTTMAITTSKFFLANSFALTATAPTFCAFDASDIMRSMSFSLIPFICLAIMSAWLSLMSIPLIFIMFFMASGSMFFIMSVIILRISGLFIDSSICFIMPGSFIAAMGSMGATPPPAERALAEEEGVAAPPMPPLPLAMSFILARSSGVMFSSCSAIIFAISGVSSGMPSMPGAFLAMAAIWSGDMSFSILLMFFRDSGLAAISSIAFCIASGFSAIFFCAALCMFMCFTARSISAFSSFTFFIASIASLRSTSDFRSASFTASSETLSVFI
mmetsp:Transcript_42369/g.70724  ORF Transcript_42369/g.70724 Transcript_42369/m.70724 type:complete len:289 (+) Transcript_42369:468-1334(+)